MSDLEPKKRLRAMHRCKHCGHVSSRADSSPLELISGVFECAQCEEASPLNVVIEDDTRAQDIVDQNVESSSSPPRADQSASVLSTVAS